MTFLATIQTYRWSFSFADIVLCCTGYRLRC